MYKKITVQLFKTDVNYAPHNAKYIYQSKPLNYSIIGMQNSQNVEYLFSTS